MADVLPSKALCYPHLEFASAAWVKGALLYWDGVCRLVGEDRPHDEGEIRELAEAGLLDLIQVSPYRSEVKRLFGERFAELLRQRGAFPEAIPRVEALWGRRVARLTSDLEELAQALEDQGHYRPAEVVRTMPEQAIPFVVTFASYVIAAERGLAPVTDDPLFAAIHMYFGETGVTSDPREAPDGMADAALLVPRPSLSALASLPVARLLEIRRKLGSQRRAFREKVEAHKNALARLTDFDEARDQTRAFAREIRDDLEAERAAMREAKLKEDWTFFGVTAPTSLSVGVTLAQSSMILGPVAGIGAVALGATNWYLHRRTKKGPNGNYVLSLQTELGRNGHGVGSGLDQLLSR
jgi:hypothetical protein